MKIACTLCGLLLAVAIANASPIVKRETNEINPLNEVYVFQDDADTVADDDRSDREKRKIGIVKLGVTNGIINFVFGKLDSFLDAKTRAIAVLDQGNKAKNAAFGIDNTQSATGQFISNLIGQKIQAGTASIGPVINSATTFFSGASSGIANAFAAKLGPLSSLSGGSASGGGSGGAGAGLGGILSSLSSLSGGLSGGLGGGSGGGSSGESSESSASASAGAGAGAGLGLNTGASAGGGINLGAFANLGGGLGR